MNQRTPELSSPPLNNPAKEVSKLKPLVLRRIARPSIGKNGDNGPGVDSTADDGLGQKLARVADNLSNRTEEVDMNLRSLAYRQYQQKAGGLPTGSVELSFAVQSMLIKPAIGTAAAILGIASGLVNGEQERSHAIAKLEEAAVVHGFRSTDVKERVLPEVEAKLQEVATEARALALATQGLVQRGLVTVSPRTGNLMVNAPDVQTEEKVFGIYDRMGKANVRWQRMAGEDVETPLTRRSKGFVEQARIRATGAGIPNPQINDVIKRGTERGQRLLQEQRTKIGI